MVVVGLAAPSVGSELGFTAPLAATTPRALPTGTAFDAAFTLPMELFVEGFVPPASERRALPGSGVTDAGGSNVPLDDCRTLALRGTCDGVWARAECDMLSPHTLSTARLGAASL